MDRGGPPLVAEEEDGVPGTALGHGTSALTPTDLAQGTDPEGSTQSAGWSDSDPSPRRPAYAGPRWLASSWKLSEGAGVLSAPQTRRPALPSGASGQTDSPPRGELRKAAREIPLPSPTALPGLGRPFFSVLRNPFLVPINELSSSLLTGSLQLGWH